MAWFNEQLNEHYREDGDRLTSILYKNALQLFAKKGIMVELKPNTEDALSSTGTVEYK